ncbi:hypothetical protein DITRI_Ditri03aG0202100 [Diplodiscus trichospermus]
MASLAAFPPANIWFTCTYEELFISFNNLFSGSSLPSNVIDVNPYRYEPQNLPDGVWFLINSKENIDMEHGFWKTKEEAREVFSNFDIIGWRTTLEYYEGQVPHENKTDWVMQVFSITRKRLCSDNEKKETSSLCRVFLVSSHERQQNVPSAGSKNETWSQPPILDANSCRRIGSSSNPEVNKHGETDVLAVAERLLVPVPEHPEENLFEMDLFSRGQTDLFSDGNFLELQDLDNPASSSNSENSSAVSFSSDECFDPIAFLQDLEDHILEQNDAGKKLNVSASNKPDEVVIVPATLASGSRKQNNKVIKDARGDQIGEGPSSSSSHKPSTSSDSQTAAAGGKKRAASGQMKNLRKKYSRFMPF